MPAYAPAFDGKNVGTDAGVAGLEAHSTNRRGARRNGQVVILSG
jgi:hypothetical protein